MFFLLLKACETNVYQWTKSPKLAVLRIEAQDPKAVPGV
jgi:hypothetical protein